MNFKFWSKWFVGASLLVTSVGRAEMGAEIRKGLDLLYRNVQCQSANCSNTESKVRQVEQALHFHSQFEKTLSEAPPLRLRWKNPSATGNSAEFEFQSPVQRPGGHPANQVHGIVYFPPSYQRCAAKFPATLIVHKLGEDIEDEKMIARNAVAADKSVVMLIFLPHFGPRRDLKTDERFINKNPEAFRLNILQALADIHQSYQVLKSLDQVDPHNMGLMGLSLGAMISLISAGIDPIFDAYSTNVGGGDLANIVTYRKSGDVDSQTGQALKEIDWSVDQARSFLSQFDAITWSLRAKNKKILMINAENDELISRTLSLDPLIEGFRSAGSEVQLIMHSGSHVFKVKEIGLWNTLRKVLLPMVNFINRGEVPSPVCSAS